MSFSNPSCHPTIVPPEYNTTIVTQPSRPTIVPPPTLAPIRGSWRPCPLFNWRKMPVPLTQSPNPETKK